MPVDDESAPSEEGAQVYRVDLGWNSSSPLRIHLRRQRGRHDGMGEKERELVVPLGAVVLAVLAVWLIWRRR